MTHHGHDELKSPLLISITRFHILSQLQTILDIIFGYLAHNHCVSLYHWIYQYPCLSWSNYWNVDHDIEDWFTTPTLLDLQLTLDSSTRMTNYNLLHYMLSTGSPRKKLFRTFFLIHPVLESNIIQKFTSEEWEWQ